MAHLVQSMLVRTHTWSKQEMHLASALLGRQTLEQALADVH